MKLVLCLSDNDKKNKEIVDRMLHALILHDSHKIKVVPLHKGAAGCVMTSDQNSRIPSFMKNENGNWLMISGVPIMREGTLRLTLEKTLTKNIESAIEHFKSFDGAFVLLFWDNKNKKLAVTTDFLGMQPIYYFRSDGTMLMASEIKGIAASGLLDVKMDSAGWGSFISFGHTIGDITMLEGVKRADPACIMVYDTEQGRLMEPHQYWEWPAPNPSLTLESIDTEQIIVSLSEDIKSYTEHASPGTLLLSGGFDSRLILCLLHRENLLTNPLTVSWGDEVRFARKIADTLCLSCDLVKPSSAFNLTREYINYLCANEVATPSLKLSIPKIYHFLKPEMRSVWEGVFPGCILTALHQPKGGFEAYISQETFSRESLIWKTAFQVFDRSKAQDLYDNFIYLLKRQTGKYSNDEFGVSQFVVRNRTRCRTALNPLSVYSNIVLPFTPGASKEFWNYAASIPYGVKASHRMYLEIFNQHFPKLNNIPFLSADKFYPHHSSKIEYLDLHIKEFLKKNLFIERSMTLIRFLRQQAQGSLIQKALSNVNLDHPDLNADFVQGLSKLTRKFDFRHARKDVIAIQLIFYWQMWLHLMEQQELPDFV
jgi:hypothetical protein